MCDSCPWAPAIRWTHSGLASRASFGLAVAAVLAFVFIPHSRAYWFVFDDFALLGGMSNTACLEVFRQPFAGMYRPLTACGFRLQFLLFGWDHPGGYVLVSGLLHTANAVLVYALARELLASRRMAVMTGLFFLLAGSVAETYLWLSAQFDLLATFFVLASVLLALSIRSSSRVVARIAVAAGLLLLGMLSKETAFVAPVILAAWLLLRGRVPRLGWSRSGRGNLAAVPSARVRIVVLSTGAFLVVVLVFVLLRAQHLPLRDTQYGSTARLFSQAAIGKNLGRLMLSFLNVPPDVQSPLSPAVFRAMALITTGLLLTALWRRPRIAAVLLATTVVSLLPVSWMSISPTLGGGRITYTSAVLFAMVFALGWRGASSAARLGWMRGHPRRNALAILGRAWAWGVPALLALSLVSISDSRRAWDQAGGISRSVIEQYRPFLTAPAVFVPNLPARFSDGPYITKCYAFRHFFGSQGVHTPPTRCLSIDLIRARKEGLENAGESSPEIFSDYADPRPEEVTLLLQLAGGGT